MTSWSLRAPEIGVRVGATGRQGKGVDEEWRMKRRVKREE